MATAVARALARRPRWSTLTATAHTFVTGCPWFAVALGVGATLRVLMMAAFFPAFVVSDAPLYLHFVVSPQLSRYRPAGYDSVLWVLHHLDPGLWLIAVVQHLLGLGIAGLVYALLRRWGVSDRLAAAATLPVLLDGMQLMLEHTPLSDVVFEFLVVAAVAVLAWRRTPSVKAAWWAGFLIGLATLVRIAGEPAIVPVLIFTVWVATSRRMRWRTTAAALAGFGILVGAYMTAYHFGRGPWALAEAGGRSLYMRTTGFVDCAKLTGLPAYERTLCPPEPLGHRRDPTAYGWFSPDHTAGMTPPPGVSLDYAFRDFGDRAIRAQPKAYVEIILRDTAFTFSWRRDNAYEYDTAGKWKLSSYATGHVSDRALATYREFGGVVLHDRQPLARWFGWYGDHVYLRGTLMLALALVALVVGVRRRRHGVLPLVVLTASLGIGLIVLPAVTVEVVWRYVLPGVPLLPLAAAAAFGRSPTAHGRPQNDAE